MRTYTSNRAMHSSSLMRPHAPCCTQAAPGASHHKCNILILAKKQRLSTDQILFKLKV